MKNNHLKRDLSQQLMTTMRTRLRVPVTVLMLVSSLTWPLQSHGLVLIKTNSGANNTVTTSLLAIPTVLPTAGYVQNATPTAADTLLFNNTINAASTFRISNVANSTLSLGGVAITNPGGAITFQNSDNQNQTISLGAAGIDMSRATQNLTISNATGGTATLSTSANQAWTIANSRTLTISSPIVLNNAVDVRFVGGTTGGTAGTVTLGSTTAGIAGSGNLNVSGMLGGTGGTVTLLGNNSTWTGALTVAGGAQVNLDQSAASQNKLSDAAALTLNRGTLNLQGTGTGTEVVASLSLGQGLNQVSRTTGTGITGVLQAGIISRSTVGAGLNVGNIGTTAASSYLTTSSLNTNLIMGGWAVAINGTTDTNWVKNATGAANGGVIAASGTDYTTQNAISSWTTPAQNILVTATTTGSGASRTINSLKIAGAAAVTVDMGAFILTLNDGLNSGGIIRNQAQATTIGGATVGVGGLTAGASDATADTLYLWNSQNTMTVNTVVQNNGAGALTLFSGGAGTVVVNANNTYSGGTVIAAGTLNLGSNTALSDVATLGTGAVTNYGILNINKSTAATGANATVANNISGTGNLTINQGTITLSGANTYTGDTTVSAGTLFSGSATALSSGSRFVLNAANVVLNLNGNSNSVAALRGDIATANVNLGSGVLTLSGNDDARSGVNNQLLSQTPQLYQGAVSGAGGLVKNGAYTQQLAGAGALSYSGPTTVNDGVLQLNKAAATSALNMNGGTFIAETGTTLNNVTTLTLNGGSTFVANASAPIANVTSLTIAASGTFAANQANLVSDTATVNLSGTGALWQLANGGSDTIGSLISSTGSRISLGAGAAATVLTVNDSAVATRVLDGVVGMSGAGIGLGSLIKNGAATWDLGGGNAYNGSTTINGGTVRVASGASVEVLPDRTAVILANTAGALLDLNGRAEMIGSLAGGGASGGGVSLGAGLLTTGRNGASTTYSGVIGGGGSVTKIGNGTLTLDGGNTFGGKLTVAGGSVVLNRVGGNTLDDGSNVALAGGSLVVNTSDVINRLTATQNSVLSLATGATLTTNHAVAATSVRSAKVSTVTRVVAVPGGTQGLIVGMGVSGADTGNPVLSAGTYIVQILNQNQVLLNTSPIRTETSNLVFASADKVAAFTGAGNWTKNGAGTVLLGGSNNLTGTMTINDGTLLAAGYNMGGRNMVQDMIGNSTAVVLGASGAPTLNLAANVVNLLPYEKIGSLSGGSSLVADNVPAPTVNISGISSAGVLALGGNNQTTTYDGRIRGGAGTWLIKQGTGQFTWNNKDALTMDGTVRVDQGEMVVAGTVGLSPTVDAVLSNQAGAKLTLNSTESGGETLSFISGGGHGATRVFPNGIRGALLGNYVNGGDSVLQIGAGGLTVSNGTAGAVFSFGGNITGTGGIRKIGNNTLELLGTNSQTGDTEVKSAAASTTSTLRMGVYSASAGVGTPTTGGFGQLSAAAALSMVAFDSGVNGNVLFDLNGSTQTVRALTTRNFNGTKIINMGGGTINVNTVSGTNSFFDGLFLGRGTVNVIATHATGWEISGSSVPGSVPPLNNNNSHTGSFNIMGGLVILNAPLDGSLGDTVHTSVGSGATLKLETPDIIGSLKGAGSLQFGTFNPTLTVTSAPQGSLATSGWSGTSSGPGNLTLAQRARMIISSNQGYTGLTTIKDAASLTLDYSGVGVNNIIPGAFRMGGGNILIRGGSSATTDSVTSSTLAAGDTVISGLSTGTRLGLGSMAREAGGILEIRGAAVTIGNPVDVVELGTLGGYATFGTTANITTWAVPHGIGSIITGLLDSAYETDALNMSSLVNFDVRSNTLNWVADAGSMRFNTAPTSGNEIIVLLNGASGDIRYIDSGGLLVTKNVGANNVRITDDLVGVGLSGGTGENVANELIVHQHNTRGSLIIDAPITDVPGHPIESNLTFSKTGQGRVILAQDNNYQGVTNIFAGVLQLGEGGTTGSLGTGGQITNNGYLVLKHGVGSSPAAIGNLDGTGSVQIEGGATETLNGSNSSYIGSTNVLSGKLRATQPNSLGSIVGLTSVAPLSTLEIGGGGVGGLTTAEPIYLRGGTLTGIDVGVTLTAPVTMGSSSSIRSSDGTLTRLSGPVLVRPGAGVTLSGAGTVIFNNINNQLGSISTAAGSNTTIQIGGNPLVAGALGSVGRVPINIIATNDASPTRGKVVVNVNDGHFVLGNVISGTGGLTLNRNTTYLTGDNTYSGPTLVGGNGTFVTGITGGVTLDANAELRVANETYTGRLGTGPVTIQSSTGGQSIMRFQTLRNVTVNNTIRINPWNSAPSTVRNALLIRQGLGSVNLAGAIEAGDHSLTGRDPKTQRAFLQSDPGGKLTLSGTIVTDANHRLNFQPVNNSLIEFAGSTSNTIWGRMLGNNTDNTTAVYDFNTTGTTILKGYSNFTNTGGTNRLNNVYIKRGTLIVDHTDATDPDAANTTQVPDGVNDDADFFVLRGATMQFNQNETAGFFATQKGSNISVSAGKGLIIDDNAVHVINGGFSGDGTVHFNAVGGAAWYGLFGPSTLALSPIIGSATQVTTVRVSDLAAASGLGQASAINLGISGVLGTAPQEVRLEFVNRSLSANGPVAHVTNKDFNLTNSGALEVKKSLSITNAGVTVVSLEDVGGLAPDMAVSGPGIVPGTRISLIDTNLKTVTLNQPTQDAFPAQTDMTFEQVRLSGVSAPGTVRIGANGAGPLVIGTDPNSAAAGNGKITATNLGNKILVLHGRNNGENTINGMIDQGAEVLSLSAHPAAPGTVGQGDMYGAGKWVLTNINNNFSGNISVGTGTLELKGNLGSGGQATSIMGNLAASRVIDFGSAGSLVFNDPNAGMLTLGSNITFDQSTTSTGEIINNGTKTLLIQGNLVAQAFNTTTGALDSSISITGARTWVLDGTNTGDNTINGSISNSLVGGATAGVTKEGPGKWILTSTNNTMTGNVTVSRGFLDMAGGSSIGDDAVVNVTNAGSDGTSLGGSTLRIRSGETIGGLAGSIGANVILDAGVLTMRNTAQTFSGLISGGGGITRTNNDTNARVSTITNKNTYTGPTTITTNGVNFVGNRFDVYHLADGASSLGNATNDASNLVINTNSGAGGLRYLGFTDQATSRLFTIGSGNNAANLWADGSVIGTTAPKIEFTNPGAIAFSGATNSTQTLVLRGGTIANNLLAPQLTNNGTGATSLSKIEGGMWVVSNPANSFTGGTSITAGTLAITSGTALGSGLVTINGGAGTGLLLRNAGTVANNITNLTSAGAFTADSGTNNLLSGGIVLGGTNLRFHIAAASASSLNIGGVISGATGTERLYIADGGTKIFSGANTYTGITSAMGGTLRLDYGASNTSKLADASALELGWRDNGIVTLLGADADVSNLSYQAGMSGARLELSGGSHVEMITGLTLLQGANTIARVAGSTANMVVGAIARATGGAVIDQGTLDIDAGGYIYSTTANAGASPYAILGGYATVAGAGWAQRQDNIIIGTAGAVASNLTTDRITIPGLLNGQIVRFASGAPTGLAVNVDYFVVNAAAADFQVSATLGGAALDITASGTTGTVFTNNATGLTLGTVGAVVSTDVGDTITVGNVPNGTLVRFVANAPSGLAVNTDYFVVNSTATTFQASATLGGAAINITANGTSATLTRSGAINTALASAYNNNTAATAFGTGINTDVLTSLTQAAATTQTLRFNQAAATTLTLSGILGLEQGGILVTPTSGAVTITGSVIRRSATTANLDTIFLQNSPNTLTVASAIQNNTGAQGITKSGPGTLLLTGANTFTGRINLQQGLLQVGDGTAGTATATLSGAAAPISSSLGTELRLNVLNAATAYNPGAFTGSGLLNLVSSNTSTIILDDDNGNWIGDLVVSGGTVRAAAANALGSNRGVSTFNNGTTLQIDTSVNIPEVITFNQGSTLTTLPAAAATLNGKQNFANTSAGGFTINIPAPTAVGSVGLNISGIIYAGSGFTKTGNGILQLSANQFTNVLDGYTGANTGASLSGQILVNAGELRVGGTRALGAFGVGNETVVASGATVDLRGQSLNLGDDPSAFREIFRVLGSGVNGTGAIRNTSVTGQFSHLVMLGNTTLSGGGFINGSRLDLSAYDSNPNNGSTLDGNFTRNNATLDGGNFELSVVGGGAVVLHQPTFSTPLSKINVNEGILRLEMDVPVNSGSLWTGISPANVTGTAGIEIGYAGATLGDQTNPTTGVGPNVGARLNLFRNMNVHHTVKITMNGVTAKGLAVDAAGGGYNYIDTGVDTIPSARTYLDGELVVLGDASRNVLHNESATTTANILEQANLTTSIQTKLIVGGQITGAGGFTKTGTREVRLTNNNTFTGGLNILRSGSTAMSWQSNTVTVNGVAYQTFGDGEGWAEYGLTLAGANARLSGTSDITLQRRGMLTLDNTNRLDATNNVGGVTPVLGGNNDDRINNAANVILDHGWLRIHGGSAAANNESIASSGTATLQIKSGTNIIDLWPTDGANQPMTLTIGKIARSPGAVLRINNLDATSTFASAAPAALTDSVRVALTTPLSPGEQSGSGSQVTNRAIAIGILGGIIPHGYLEDIRDLAYNSGNAFDQLNQGRNQQFLSGSHFMTQEGGFLRPLDDSEYFTPVDGVMDVTSGASGQNVNLNDVFSIVRQDMSINSLRFGPVADNNGSGGSINGGTTLTSYIGSYNPTLIVDGKLSIASGMISSAFFTVGNSSTTDTFIQGGTLDFGTREAIINNQNGFVRFTDGVVVGGSLQIRSNIAGTGGLLKTGFQQVVLDGMNTYSGLTTVSDGNLLLRNGRMSGGAGGPGNGYKIEGNGNLLTNFGIVLGTAAAPEDILVGILQGGQTILQAQGDLTSYFGDITVDNVDVAGQTIFTPLINANGANSTLIINGDIYGGDTAISNDVTAIDSRILSTNSSSNAQIILRGQIGDRGVGGVATPAGSGTATVTSLQSSVGARINENEVFRFTVEGNNDLNVTMEKQYAAAGRLTLNQGILNISYTPGAGPSDTGFWTDTAISRIANKDSTPSFALNGNTTQHGFAIGATTGAAGNTFLFLGQPGKDGISGQNFNMASWNVAAGSNTWIGGVNETGSVTFGTGTGSLVLGKAVRLYGMSGGTVNMNMRLNGQSMQKVGRGTVVLQNTGLNTASDTSSFELGGGTMIVDHAGQNVARLGASGNFTFRGGSLIVQGNPSTATSASYATDNNAGRVVAFTSGGSEIVADSRGQSLVTLNLGNANANSNAPTLTRTVGATANLVEAYGATGLAIMTLNMNAFTTAAARSRVMSWATYGNQARTAVDFGMVEPSRTVFAGSTTFTGTVTAGLSTVTNVSSVVNLVPGMSVNTPFVVTNIAVTNGGTGYTSAPTVVFTGGGGTGATATANFSAGAVTSITITNPGTGYVTAPVISFTGGAGTGATATATIAPLFTAGSVIVAVSPNAVTLSSSAVATMPAAVTFVPNSFNGTTTQGSNVISAVSSTAGLAAGMTVAGTSIVNSTVTVTAGGTGYTVAPTVALTGGGGTGATATATVTAGVVTAVTITNAGFGYTSAPTVAFTPVSGGTGATATATLTPLFAANSTITGISGNTITMSSNAAGTASAPVAFTTSAIAATANDVLAYARAPEEYQNNVASWTAGMDVSENGGAGFIGTLGANLDINTLRFDTLADSLINLGGRTLAISGDGAGAVLVSSNVGAANKTIGNGTLATSGVAFTGDASLLKIYTGNVSANSTLITSVSDFARLEVGMPISGTGIPSGTTISFLNPGAATLTLSVQANANANGATLTTKDADDLIRNTSSTAGLFPGMTLTGLGVPAGTIILSITGTTLKLSADVAGTAGMVLNGSGIALFGDANFFKTYTGNLTALSTSITNVSNIAGLVVGMPITGTGIPTGATIAAVNPGANTVTLSVAATAGGTGVALTTDDADNLIRNVPVTSGLAAGMTVTDLPVVSAIRVTAGGSGYTTAPTVVISGGTGATAVATVSGGAVTAVTVTNRGFAYTGIPTVTFSGGGGSGAAASVVNYSSIITAVTVDPPIPTLPQTLTLSLSSNIINGSAVSLVVNSPELIFHHYGQGNLNVDASISGEQSVTVAGPSTTNASEFNTTGTVRFNGNNSYTGRTFLNGGVLEIASTAALGIDPSSVNNTQLTMNGGTLRWTGGVASLGNRGITLNGSGGVIEVTNPDGNLAVGTGVSGTQAALVSEDIFRGDLVKTGPGALTLQGSSTGYNSGFLGLLDIRQGSLVVMVDVGDNNAGTLSVLGANRSWEDGTIFRQGTNFQAFLGAANNAGVDWNIEEFMTFEGGNTFTYTGLLDINANNGVSGALDTQLNLGNRRPLNLNGVTNIAGNTTFDIGFASNLRFALNAGYVTGSGDIIKDGQGQMEFRGNIPDWKGNLVIKQGTVYAISAADMLGSGYTSGKTITLGDVERQGTAQLFIQNPDGVQNWLFEVDHDINVMYNPTQTKRLGIDNVSNGGRFSYNGDITLNDNLNILLQDGGISSGGEQAILNFNGDFKDGVTTSGNLVIQGTDNGGANDNVNGRMTGYAVFNGDNHLWTGDVHLSANLSYDQDKTTVLRLGNNLALTAANDLIMNFNSVLQTGGQTATIGALSTLGGTGAFNGDAGTMSGSTNGSTEIIENAASTPGTLTIAQSTPVSYEAVWDAKFRDGVLNSQFFNIGTNTHLPSAALNVVKSGSGWSVMTLDNDYTGTTTVAQGVLQIGRDSVGDSGANNALGTTVNSGATVAGTGWVQGGLTVQAGGIVSPGDAGGNALGTLNVNGTALFASGSSALLQVRLPTYNNSGAVDTGDANYSAWRSTIGTDAFSNALQDIVTTGQHDMLNVSDANGLGTINIANGTQVTLVNDGYTPKAGDIFHLFKAGTLLSAINTGAAIRTGLEVGSDLNLFELGGSLRWDTTLLNTLGILLVISSESAGSLPTAPTINSGPTRTPTSGQLTPGATFTLSGKVDSPSAVPITFQWLLNDVPISPSLITSSTLLPLNGTPAGNGVTSTITLVASSDTKGTYKFVASNSGGQIVSTGVVIDVNDTPLILAGLFPTGGHPAPLSVNPSLPGTPISTTLTARMTGPGPYTAQWFKVVNSVETLVFTQTGAAIPVGQPQVFTSNFTINEVTEADQGDYICRFTTLGGTVTSNPATLTVRDAVSNVVATRTRNPGPTYQGETIIFSVTASGEAPLTYKWFKNSTEITGQTASTLSVTSSAIQTVADTYYARVTNALNSADSNTVSLQALDPKPVITSGALASQTLLSGGNLTMSVTAGGRPAIRYQWKRNGTSIAGATSGDYIANPLTVAQGGTYTCEVSNPTTTKLLAGPAEIVVVDSSTKIVPVKLGAPTTTLTANVGRGTKTNVTYKWYTRTYHEEIIPPVEEGDAPTVIQVPDDVAVSTTDARFTGEEYTGTAVATLKIANAIATDDGLYVCKVKGPDNVSVIGCFQDVRVYDSKPINLTATVLKKGIVGGYYTEQIVVDQSRNRSPVSFAVTGTLPPGLTLDKNTGVISGRPTTAKTYTFTTTATNLVGTSVEKITSTIVIDPLPSGLAGTYAGPIGRNPVLNGNLGGRFDMVVTTTGTASGKVTFGTAAARSFTGGVLEIDVNGVVQPNATLKIPATTTLPALTLVFKLVATPAISPTPPATLLADATITDGTNTVTFKGWRNNWAATAVANVSAKADAFVGDYTFGILLPDGSSLIGNPQVPQGAGYGIFKVATAGTFTFAGRTPDGETLAGSYWLGPNGQFFLYQTLYTTTIKGSILGELRIEAATPSTNNDLFGDITLVRPPNNGSVTTARTYRSGFGTTQTATGVTPTTVTTPVALIAVGGRYIAPLATGPVFMGLTATVDPVRNAELIFSEDGVLPVRTTAFPVAYNKDVAGALNPNIPVTIGDKSVVKVPLAKSSANLASTTFVPVVATGAFSGKFILSDSFARLPLAPLVIARTVSYQGVVIRERTSAIGQPRVVENYGLGHFIIDQLPLTVASPANSTPKISGSVMLEKAP